MENRLPKRLSAWLLTLVMLLSLVPAMGVTASAADDTSYTKAEIRNYYTFATYLRSSDSRDLKLMEDINYTVGIDDVPINVIRNQKLDLNGHKITIDASRRTGFVHLLSIRRGEFTLYDSVGGGELAVSFPNDDKAYSIIMMSSEKKDEPSKFTMNGGTLTKLHPNMTYTYGASGCIGDDYFNKPENGKRSQITINGGTINCPYEWDRSQSLLDFEVEAMPLALQLRYSNLTINGGTFNGIVWTDTLWRGEQDTEPRVVLNGGEFNSPFVVEGMQKDATQIVIDGAHFKDGFHVNNGYSINTDVGTVPVLLLKSGVFDSPDKNPKLDIYNVTANSYGNGVNSDATARAKLEMILHAMKCFPNSAIKVNGKFYTSENIESLVGKNNDDFYLKLNSSTPIEVIRDAWGVMESVTLDGKKINYAKDWKGTVERMDNSKDHTLKFTWKPLASELVNAGYTYRTTCEHYISGSTAVQQTDTIDASKTSHTITIEKGADPKVYSYDLQLNLQKDGSNIGIIGNQHIVRLVVDPCTPIDSVTLNVPKLTEGATSGGNFTLSGTNTGVSTINTVWEGIPTTGAVAGNFYAARITLTAKDGYAFNTSTQVKLNGDYLSTGSSIKDGGAGMTIYVNVPVRHEHKYGPWQIAGNRNVHFRECSCGVQEDEPHEWKYLEGQDKYKCTVCGYEIDGEKDRITYVYASPRSPIAGEHPDDYTAAEWVKIVGANYKVESIVWKNMDDTNVTTFESGKNYKGTVTFKADTGFAFDRDRIYGSQIFDSSKAVIVDDYTLTDKGSTLTATFKLKDNTVKPGLNVKVKLPTLNDKIGQSLPAVELVDTTLPGNVELVYVVCEDSIFTGAAITDPNYRVKPNQTYNYMAMLKFKDGSDITNSFNVSYTVTDGGDAETYIDTLPEVGVLAMYQTPDTSQINVSVRGTAVSWNGKIDFTVTLYETGTTTEKGKVTVTGTGASGQATQDFTLTGVAPGTYDLVVTKSAHLKYTVKNITVGNAPLDLTAMTGKSYQTITLLCGDIDGDGWIDFSDYQELLKSTNYGKQTSAVGVNKIADLDGDTWIDFSDYQILLSSQHYGKSAVSVNFGG